MAKRYVAATIRGDGRLDSEFTDHGSVHGSEAAAERDRLDGQYEGVYWAGSDGYLYGLDGSLIPEQDRAAYYAGVSD